MRPLVATINTQSLVANTKYLQTLSPNTPLLACVKANAYGHGAPACALALEQYVAGFCVCSVEEALALRTSGIKKTIILLEGCFSEEEVGQAMAHKLETIITTVRQYHWLVNYCEAHSQVSLPRLWIKINTGMNRLGLSCTQAQEVFAWCNKKAVGETVVMTHLHSADEDIVASKAQIRMLQQHAPAHAKLSWCNSAAWLNGELRGGDYARIGIALYGAPPVATHLPLLPVMTLTAQVISIYSIASGQTVGYGAAWLAQRTTDVAIVSCGYADGYPRQCPSGTHVIINGMHCALIGRVSMDMLAVDITDVDVQLGDAVELWGTRLKACDIAKAAQTISYHLFTGVSARVPRQYIEN